MTTAAWDRAARLGAALTPPGPSVTPREAAIVVESLRENATRAHALVAEASGLSVGEATEVCVVDRPTWIAHNATTVERLFVTSPTSLLARVGNAWSAFQYGVALAVVAPRVLGQYDPFAEPPTLLLVAPNVLEFSVRLGIDTDAFGMWVCCHELTHQAQFSHAPWLADHLRTLIVRIVAAESAPLGGWRPGAPPPRTVADLVLGHDGRRALEEAAAIMTLLEGHADVMMDRTGAVPDVQRIRTVIDSTGTPTGVEAFVRAVTGIDLKQAQYRQGAAFCRHVIGRGGLPLLHRAFDAPDMMPTADEIRRPDRWIDRTEVR